MLLPLAVLPALAWGLGRTRRRRSDYPASWAAAAERVDPAPARMLFLPWHGYQPFTFTQDRTVATPAGAFFPGPVLSSSAVEVGPLRSDSTSQQQAAMDDLVAAGGGTDFAASLVPPRRHARGPRRGAPRTTATRGSASSPG